MLRAAHGLASQRVQRVDALRRRKRTYRAAAAEAAPWAGAGSYRQARGALCAAQAALQPTRQRRKRRVKLRVVARRAAGQGTPGAAMRPARVRGTHRTLRFSFPRARSLFLAPARRGARCANISQLTQRSRGASRSRNAAMPRNAAREPAAGCRARAAGGLRGAGRALATQASLLCRGAQVLQLVVTHRRAYLIAPAASPALTRSATQLRKAPRVCGSYESARSPRGAPLLVSLAARRTVVRNARGTQALTPTLLREFW